MAQSAGFVKLHFINLAECVKCDSRGQPANWKQKTLLGDRISWFLYQMATGEEDLGTFKENLVGSYF